MKRWTLPLVAFLLAGLFAYILTRSLVRGAPAATAWAPHPAPVLRSVPAAVAKQMSSEDEHRSAMMKEYFKDRAGPEMEAERMKIIAKLAEVHALNSNSELMPAMVDMLGLTDAQAERVQQSFDEALARMSRDLKSRVTVAPEDSPAKYAEAKEKLTQIGGRNPDRPLELVKLEKFDIPATPDAGASIMEDLRREITAAAGPLAAEVLTGDENFTDRFGSFGAYPIQGTIMQYSPGDQTKQIIEFETLDNDGKPLSQSGYSEASSARLRLGEALDGHYMEDAH